MDAPAVLIVDDGELDEIEAILTDLGAAGERCSDGSLDPLPRPRALLVTSGPRAMEMPPLMGEAEPIWVCLYGPDFLPLREHLKDKGVHYLVSAELPRRGLALFLNQLLHGGSDERGVRRIPLSCALTLEVGFEKRAAQLIELSRESCVIATGEEIPDGPRLKVCLPAELTGDQNLELEGQWVRSERDERPGEVPQVHSVIRFPSLGADDMARIHDLLTGHAPGAQVTPLVAEPDTVSEDSRADWLSDDLPPDFQETAGWNQEHGERRRDPRVPYDRQVDALRWPGHAGLRTGLGHDLSRSGVRIIAAAPPPLGTSLTLALYGSKREEPVLVDAEVVRAGEGDVGLRFLRLDPGQRRGIDRLIEAAPQLEDLEADRSPLHIAEMIRD
ncbi:MAG: PilZ domain-containing protein [Myxococcota bacterium]